MIDTALQVRESAGNPIRVGMIGAGETARAIALQLGSPVPGIRLAGIANRSPEHGERAVRSWHSSMDSRRFRAGSRSGDHSRDEALTDDPLVLTACGAIDVIVEVTGTIAQAACVVLNAFEHGKHVVLVNAELDSLLGPILKAKADSAGVVFTRHGWG